YSTPHHGSHHFTTSHQLPLTTHHSPLTTHHSPLTSAVGCRRRGPARESAPPCRGAFGWSAARNAAPAPPASAARTTLLPGALRRTSAGTCPVRGLPSGGVSDRTPRPGAPAPCRRRDGAPAA